MTGLGDLQARRPEAEARRQTVSDQAQAQKPRGWNQLPHVPTDGLLLL